MANSKKNIKETKNKTQKIRNINKLLQLTKEEQMIVCKQSSNTYDTFEDKIDDIFKKNNIDIVSTSYNLEKDIVYNLKKAINTKGILPNNDFYSYINDRWINEYKLTEEKRYIVQVDDFRITQDKVYRDLIQIITDFISNPSTKDTEKAKCIKKAYTATRGYNTTEQTKILAKSKLDEIDETLSDKKNLWKLLAMINMNEIISWGSPFVWSINPDDKNPKIYKCYLEQPKLSLIDNLIYNDYEDDSKEDKIYKKKYRNKFFDYINNIFKICFGDNHDFNVKDVFDTEKEILNAIVCNFIKEKDYDEYNVITKDEALKNFGFNWEEFCIHLGFKKIPEEFVTTNINYLLCGTKLFIDNWDSPKWRTFWVYIFLRQQCRFDEKGWINYYRFQGNFVRGQAEEVDKEIRGIFQMGFLFNTFLTNQYILKYNNFQAINYVKTMAEDLKTVFIRIINRNNWLQKKTKIKALEKVKKIKLIVGSPEALREDPLLDYKEHDPWGNLKKMAKWRHNKAIELVGKNVIDIPLVDWSQIPPKFAGSQAYVVNAFYTATENSIYIPLGYIQKPFVDLDERGLEYNLSRVGFTIAHEMSHALDDWGSKYDEFGILNNWWTKEDSNNFKKIQNDVIKQYETFASYDGIIFNAESSIGEDLADISGLAICQEYLRDFQLKNQDELPIQALSFEAFYTFFAIQYRQKISKKAIISQLKTNPHPLDKYRCNVPLSRTNVFRAIYNVKKGDKMWWHSLNNIWGN
jgi:putative endopeptidase